MCIFKRIKTKNLLAKYGKLSNTNDAIVFLQQIAFNSKEKEWVKRIIKKHFKEDDADTLLLVLEVD